MIKKVQKGTVITVERDIGALESIEALAKRGMEEEEVRVLVCMPLIPTFSHNNGRRKSISLR